MKKTIKVVSVILIAVILLFSVIFFRLYAVRVFDTKAQEKHLEQLNLYYDSSDFEPVDENLFINFNKDDDTIKLNEIKYLASHNSYKKNGPELGRLIIGLASSKEEARALDYGYKSLTEQLQLGIRSMELDLRLRKDVFHLTHVPLVDNSSVAPVFSMALREIALFSQHNPNHIPIIILLEIKNDWMVLDPKLRDIGAEELRDLNDLIIAELDNHLVMPEQMKADNKTLNETIVSQGWPSVQSLLGKVIIVLHPGEFSTAYYELNLSDEKQAMFIGVYHNDIEKSYASFVVHNSLDVELISSMVELGLIVRTRIDDNLVFSWVDFDKAMSSGAQILTSDFTIGRSDLLVDQIIYLLDKKTIIRKS